MRNQRRLDALLFPITHWHWKAAVMSATFRAGACMVALYRSPLHAREHFGLVEAAYVLTTCGIFSAWQQQALGIKPRRLAWLIVVLVIPLGSLAADSGLHLWLDSGNMRALGIGALIGTLISSMFHWHVMSNGAMIIGASGRSFLDDMRQMPRLVVSFVANPVRWLAARLRPSSISVEAEDLEAA
ncbi:MAG TPA: hypothetical protein VME86_09725 [Acidobacteriaceae bacterium]|nr:hypothetical protein [Acidobacteriaceae bacterium]